MRVVPECFKHRLFSRLQVDKFQDVTDDHFDDYFDNIDDNIMSYDNGNNP